MRQIFIKSLISALKITVQPPKYKIEISRALCLPNQKYAFAKSLYSNVFTYFPPFFSSGLIIDWLQKIDPELQAVPMSLRQKLLFNNNPHLLTVFR